MDEKAENSFKTEKENGNLKVIPFSNLSKTTSAVMTEGKYFPTANGSPSPGLNISPSVTLFDDSPPHPPSAESPELRVTDSPTSQTSSTSNPNVQKSSDIASSNTTTPTVSPKPFSSKKSSLFQPFLPNTDEDSRSPRHPVQQLQKQFLPFSIDNILRPNFGLLATNPFFNLAASLHQRHQELLQLQHYHQQQLAASKPVNETGLGSTHKPNKISPKVIPPKITESKTESNNNNHQPVDLSSKPSSEKPPREKSASQDKDEDLPPGMVRGPNGQLWPAWVFCTRYSDRPSSGPRSRKMKKSSEKEDVASSPSEKRPRTAFSSEQLARLKKEFDDNRYLTEERRKNLSAELGLNENQIKIWFQNKRAKIKKTSGSKGELAQMLMAQGLYNHSTVSVDEDEEIDI